VADSSPSNKGILCTPTLPTKIGIDYFNFKNGLMSLHGTTNHSREEYKDIKNLLKYVRGEDDNITHIELAHIVDPNYTDKFSIAIRRFNQECNDQLIYLFKYFR
jgi:hypothetical protein